MPKQAAIFSRLAVLAAILAGPAFGQAPPNPSPTPTEHVTVTAEERQEALKAQTEADKAAAEARRQFQGLRDRSGDRAIGCRKAAEADRDYALAISEAGKLSADAQAPLKDRLEARIQGMETRRANLREASDRICRGIGGPPPARPNAPQRRGQH